MIKNIDLNNINTSEIVFWLKKGKVLVMPTETAYGLIADSTNRKAVFKIYKIKGRKFTKPLPLACSSLWQVKKFFYLPSKLEQISQIYWPGPLSLQLKIKNNDIKVKKLNNTLAVRVSSYKLLRQLASKLGKPLTATSANLSGKGEFYSGSKILSEFNKLDIKPDILIDAGKIPRQKPSTIIGLKNSQITILRQGSVVIK